jgi:hypothetical protein
VTVFEDWKRAMTCYIQKHIDRKLFHAITDELDADIEALSDCYTAVLLENGVIDGEGNATDTDFDEDDLLETILERFLAAHACADKQALEYAALANAYLTLVEEAGEDL